MNLKLTGIFGLGAVLAAIYIHGIASSYVAKIEELTRDNAKLAGRINYLEGMERGYKVRIDARDRAIDASKCKAQIRNWILKPSLLPSPIPKPFSIPGQ